MAFTYLTLNIIFCMAVLLLVYKVLGRPSKAWWITLACILVLTGIFDNLAIWLGLFTYAPDKILNISIGLAPIEDFFYALLVCIIVPALWKYFDKSQPQTSVEEHR